MKQIYLVVYLESLGCTEVRKDKNGMYVMRNTATGKISGVPMASNGDILKDATVCNVCRQLGVDVPPSTSKEMEEMMKKIHEDVEKRISRC